MPAVLIRQLDALGRIIGHTTAADQRELLFAQAAMILRAGDESVPEAGRSSGDPKGIRRGDDTVTSVTWRRAGIRSRRTSERDRRLIATAAGCRCA